MRPIAFIATLFLMAGACLVIGLADGKPGWLVGSGVFLAVGLLARNLRQREAGSTGTGPRFGFFAVAILLMCAAMGFLFWLQTSA
ncbi:MAG: hypothetical protein AB7E72_04755 [Lysobacterales bacterium]